MKRIDAHIHIERGAYTLDWIQKFADTAVSRGIEEIWLLEHCYRFREFIPMYDSVCAYSDYIDNWFHRKAGVLGIVDYLRLSEMVRGADFPARIKFGLEICYFKAFENFAHRETKNLGLDFLVGSVHFIDDFAFDHKAKFWEHVDVDNAYRRYFETSVDLAKSGLYDGIAHPDSIKLFGHQPSFSLSDDYDELAKQLAKNGMYAEMNSGCHRRSGCELGMNVEMIRAMKRHSVRILTASDAHCPEDVGLDIVTMEKIVDGVIV